jgi:hypothetical protein
MYKVLCVIVVMEAILLGCAGFSTRPPEVPPRITITDEGFERDYVLRTLGTPASVDLSELGSDYWMELWFYPERELVVVFFISKEKCEAKTYHYGGAR